MSNEQIKRIIEKSKDVSKLGYREAYQFIVTSLNLIIKEEEEQTKCKKEYA